MTRKTEVADMSQLYGAFIGPQESTGVLTTACSRGRVGGRAKSRGGIANVANASGRAKPSNDVRKGIENEGAENAAQALLTLRMREKH